MDPAFDYRGLRLRGEADLAGETLDAEMLLQGVNHFRFAAEMDHFSRCVLNGKGRVIRRSQCISPWRGATRECRPTSQPSSSAERIAPALCLVHRA
jgi:hypothetical protein